jgi:hypothetical protein
MEAVSKSSPVSDADLEQQLCFIRSVATGQIEGILAQSQ